MKASEFENISTQKIEEQIHHTRKMFPSQSFLTLINFSNNSYSEQKCCTIWISNKIAVPFGNETPLTSSKKCYLKKTQNLLTKTILLAFLLLISKREQLTCVRAALPLMTWKASNHRVPFSSFKSARILPFCSYHL